MRFVRIAGLLGFIALTAYTVEQVVHALKAPAWDLTAHYGPGQSLLYVVTLACIGLFLWLEKWEAARASTTPPQSPLYRPFQEYRAQRHRVVRGFLAGMLPTLAATVVCYAFLIAVGLFTWKDHLLQRITPTVVLQTTFSLLVVVVLTTTEELIFRAFLFNYLYTKRTPAVAAGAVLASSLIFASIHRFRDFSVWLDPHNWPLFITLTMLGSLLCLTYMAGESLACAVGVHTGILLPEVFRNQSHLMDMHQSAAQWWFGVDSDIRTAPITWGLILGLGTLLWMNRARLNALARIPAVDVPPAADEPEFTLPQEAHEKIPVVPATEH